MRAITDLLGVHVRKPVQNSVDDLDFIRLELGEVRFPERQVFRLRIIEILAFYLLDFFIGDHLTHDLRKLDWRGAVLVLLVRCADQLLLVFLVKVKVDEIEYLVDNRLADVGFGTDLVQDV